LYEERHCGMRVFVISFGINTIQIVRIISPYEDQVQPMKLEDLQANAAVRGILSVGLVTVVYESMLPSLPVS